jgi:5-methylcytosine-specific restriction endonuclease McrA
VNRTKINKKANEEMKRWCIDHDLMYCEKCGGTFGLTFAHLHKRVWYYDKPDELLWDRSQWRLLCIECHTKIEFDKEATQKLFSG